MVSETRGVGAASKLNVLGKNKPIIEESVTVMLSETPTQILFSLSSFIVASDTREVIHTDERNARYDTCIKAHKNVDGFVARTTQTKNNQLKNQNEMAAPNAFREFGTQAISYEIKDETSQASATNTENDMTTGLAVGTDTTDDLNGLNSSVRKFVTDTVGVALVTPGCLLDTTTAIKPPPPGEYHIGAPKSKGDKSNKNKSMVSQANRSMANNSEAPSETDENVGFSLAKMPAGKSKAQDVSSASSGNNSTPDNVIPSGSKANISQSNAGDSNMDDSEDGGSSRVYGGNAHFTEEDSMQILRENEIKKILGSPMLMKRLHMIERAIQQNANYRSQLDYRDLPDIQSLNLLSADRMKSMESADPLFGSSMGLTGKSTMLKRAFTDRTKGSTSHGLNFDSSSAMNDAMSTHSSDGGAGSESGGLKLKADGLLPDSSSKVKKLFSYSNPELIQGRMVSSMTWNVVSTDLLAVGYGRSLDLKKFQNQTSQEKAAANEAKEGKDAGLVTNNTDIPSDEAQEGLVLFWSLRNPDFPEKILRTSHAVTAVEFSRQNPMILAVGLSNGDVNIYDVKREGASWGVPVETSAGMEGSHLEPVWQLKWIIKGAERLETLVSISTDGRILEWNLKKGLVMSKLMQLKKSGAVSSVCNFTASFTSFLIVGRRLDF
jgi:hypothetical protein